MRSKQPVLFEKRSKTFSPLASALIQSKRSKGKVFFGSFLQ
jgi:hypothetical protein